MRKNLITAGLFAFLLGSTAPFVTGVAHAGCSGAPGSQSYVCDCSADSWWDTTKQRCLPKAPYIHPVPPGPFVCSTTGLICNMPGGPMPVMPPGGWDAGCNGNGYLPDGRRCGPQGPYP